MGKRISPARARQYAAVEHDMDEATLDGARPACEGRPEGFTDYRSEEEPEVYAAQRECVEGCKLLEICKRKARLERPAWGVHAGDVWGDDRPGVGGRIIRKAPNPATLSA